MGESVPIMEVGLGSEACRTPGGTQQAGIPALLLEADGATPPIPPPLDRPNVAEKVV